MKNIFEPETVDESIARINALTPETPPQWGSMNAPQMLAHLNVAYEMAFENKHPKPNAIVRFLLRKFVKPTVCGDRPYKRNAHTAPAFKMTEPKDFYREKTRLISYLHRAQQLGERHFEGKESLSFGKLTAQEWNVMFYKHMDYHLSQFGV